VSDLPEEEQDASARTPLIAPLPSHLQQQLQTPDQTYLDSRTEAMQDVESHIAELGTVFNRLATMLADQRTMVESVHDNIEDAADNVNRGQMALLNTLTTLQSNRRLAAKVTGILVLFVLFFIIFLS
jgi:syntaxin 5